MTIKSLNRKYCGPQLVDRIKKLTNACYMSSVEETMAEFNCNADPEEIQYAVRSYRQYGSVDPWWLDSLSLTNELLSNMKQKIDDRYLQKLMELSSKQIEDILWVHEKGKVRRAPRTVESLISELTRRSLLEDFSC